MKNSIRLTLDSAVRVMPGRDRYVAASMPLTGETVYVGAGARA